jgi:hypothetical protein
MPISRGQMPRQMYGLGSIVKKAVKGVTGAVKKIAGSGLGKAALLGLGGAGLMGMGPLSALGGLGASSGTGIASILSKGKSFLGGLTTGQRLAGSLGLAALASAPQEVQEESSRDIGALKKYLASYYENLGYSADEIAENVARDTAEYTSGAGGYADGGRIGYQDGTDFEKYLKGKEEFDRKQNAEQLYKEFLENKRRQKVAEQKTMAANGGRIGYNDGTNLKKDFLIKKGYGDMVENMSVIEIDELFNSVKGTTTAANTYREPAYMGGRMGYAMGTDQIVDQASGIMGLPQNINKAGVKELDLRESGGFIPPVGIKEKADDIPAMLSNNEFVFTADAVRGMGDGNVNKGAQRMYDMMKKLEKGGRV